MTAPSVEDCNRPHNRGLRSRLLTGTILGTTMVAIVVFGSAGLVALTLGVLLALAAVEWAALAGWQTRSSQWRYAALTLAAAGALWLCLQQPIVQGRFLSAVLLIWGAATLAVILAERNHDILPRSTLPLALIGWLVLIPLWLSVVWLKMLDTRLLLALLALIWGADTLAYFVGRRWGKRRLAGRVSPGKSWAGVGGALAVAPVIGVALATLYGTSEHSALGFCLLSVATVALSIIGDLFESLVKRHAGVKDSGTLLPGHGGVLDRMDSLSAAAPLFYWGVTLLVPRT